MAHTFLSFDMSKIPQATKDNIPNFWLGKFSNDKSRLLIDGYNDDRELVQPIGLINAWLQWEDDPQVTFDVLISTSIEYTKDQILAEFNKPESIWYSEPTEEEDS